MGSVDGRPVVVSGSEDGIMRLWDARTGVPIGRPLQHAGEVNSVALGAVDGRPVLISGGQTILLWDAHTGVDRPAARRAHLDSNSIPISEGRIVCGRNGRTE
jgi:WD40 repeat protein